MKHKWMEVEAGPGGWRNCCLRFGCFVEQRVTLRGGQRGGYVVEYRRRGGEWRAPEDRRVPKCEGRPA